MTYDDEHLAELRRDGADAARRAIAGSAPKDPLDLVAWTQGFGSEPDLAAAVEKARAAGHTWRQVAVALGRNMRTVMTKYGGGYEVQRRYRERRRTDDRTPTEPRSDY